MDSVGAPPAQGRRVATKSVRLGDVRPDSVLRLDPRAPRGFWARGGSWVAHTGAAARVRVDGAGSDSGPFRDVWCQARAISSAGGEGPMRERARFYGGFAFRQDHRPEGMWSGFPAGLFLLPEVEVEGGPSGCELRVHTVVSPDANGDAVDRALSARLEQIRARLSLDGPDPGGGRYSIGSRVAGHPAPGARTAWDRVIAKALEEIRSGRVSKVVLARTLDVTPANALDPVDVLGALWAENPRAHVFLFEPEPGAVLVGAAPETVATVYGRDFHATAVAGSVPRGDTPEETSALAMRLLASEKDLLEHRFAVEDMVARLEDIAETVGSEWEPHVITLSRIQHLETHIRATLPPDSTVLQALEALHPTPAVCGLPRDEALGFIHEEEPFDRGWYAGPVGWFDLEGSGVFAPALRTAVGQGGAWRLFAGAGIVAGSEAALEWEETGIKFEPVLRALAASASG